MNIIFENNDFIVINKPAGLIVHGADHISENTLVDELLNEYPKIIKVGDDPARPGIVHRLDKLVSGLMVVAKTQDCFEHLKKQFKNRSIKKTYQALVYGKTDKDEDKINFPIQRSAKGYKMAALPKTNKGGKNPAGRTAITEFLVIKKFINYTHLKIKIKTGRTHQIRVHMSAYGHPVVGDNLYGTKKTKAKNKKLNIDRLFLVAIGLKFIDQNGQAQNYEIELPDQINNFIKNLK